MAVLEVIVGVVEVKSGEYRGFGILHSIPCIITNNHFYHLSKYRTGHTVFNSGADTIVEWFSHRELLILLQPV